MVVKQRRAFVGAYSPTSLGPITSVDVVILSGVDANHVDQHMRNAAGAPSVTLLGDVAQRIADLWRGLQPGEQARCHIPPYGLRFRSGERVVCEASLCWKCHNILGDAEGQPLHYEFDSEHPTARDLLAEIRRAVGDADPG
jgi:hypothetical protein